MSVTVGEQVNSGQGMHFIRLDECSLTDLQADGEEAQRMQSLGGFSLGVHSVNACGLAIELIEFIQG